MGHLRNSVVGRTVFSSKDGLEGKVIREDGLTIVVRLKGLDDIEFNRRLTVNQFRKNYRLTESKQLPIDEVMKRPKLVIKQSKYPNGDSKVGGLLWNFFLNTIKNVANQDLNFKYITSKQITIRYNSKIIFRIFRASRHLIMITHRSAVSPQVMKYAWSIDPDHTKGSVKFVFYRTQENPIIRALIYDLLYAHQIIDYGGK